MKEAVFRQDVTAQGFSDPELVEREPGLSNAEHSHDFSVAILVLDGEITVTTQSGVTTCRAGDHFQLDSGIPHSEQYGPTGARMLLSTRTP